MRALSALCLSDGRPGHYNLSLGLLGAAGHLRPLSITRCEVRRGRWPGAPLAAWSNSGLAPERLLSTVYGLDAKQLAKVDLIVSAGAETLAANVACARIFDAANIFYGSLRYFRPHDFSLVLTSFPANASRARHAFALKPSQAASTVWQAPREKFVKPPRRLALLVGGNSGESRYTCSDWDDLIGLIATLTQTNSIRWFVSNSRRTPDAVSDRLASLPLEQFIDVRAANSTPLAQLLATSDAALVTDESSSMVSDAVSAGIPVLGVSPVHHRLSNNEQAYRAYLTQSGWYAAVPLAGLSSETVLGKLSSLTPTTEDPSLRLAQLLRDRLPDLFAN